MGVAVVDGPLPAALVGVGEPPRATTDPEAERALLGAVLLDPEAAQRLAGLVSPEDFYDPRYALLWESVLAVRARQEPLDVHTLADELRRRQRLQTVGGAQALGDLTDGVVTSAHSEAYARIVRELARVRRASEAYHDAFRRLQVGVPLDAVRAELDAKILPLARTGASGLVRDDLEDLFAAVIDRLEGRERPIATPWPAVDALLGGGLWPGLYVLVGGTGAGKTQWAVQAAVRAAQAGHRVLYLALELSRRDLAARVLGTAAGVSWSDLLRGRLSDDRMSAVARAARDVRELPFHTECAPPYGYGAEALSARAWTLRPQVVVVDYLQLCAGRAGEEPRQAVGRVAYVARAIARDLGAVVIVLSSTARANYADLVHDPNKDPGDLVGLGKESGEIEYAADGVLVLAKGTSAADARVLVVAKNRCGPLGRAELAWNGTAFSGGEADEEVIL